MFGYLEGDYQGLALVENAQPRTLCQEAVALNVAVNKIFFKIMAFKIIILNYCFT